MELYEAEDITMKLYKKHFKEKDMIAKKPFALICAGIDRSELSEPRIQKYYAAQRARK